MDESKINLKRKQPQDGMAVKKLLPQTGFSFSTSACFLPQTKTIDTRFIGNLNLSLGVGERMTGCMYPCDGLVSFPGCRLLMTGTSSLQPREENQSKKIDG